MSSQSSAAKHWCFTINHYTVSDDIELMELQPHTEYLVFGKEVSPTTGVNHYQGYVVLKEKARLTALKKRLSRAHLEVARGTPKQASDYCKKENDYLEFGKLPDPPHKLGGDATATRYQEAWELAKLGDIEAIDSRIRFVNYNVVRRIAQDHQKMPANLDAPACGIWYHGPPRSGKSWKARSTEGTQYLKPCNKWWDGYQNQDIVIIEDIGLEHDLLGYHLKIWADRYAFPAEQKGTTICIRPKKIIVTSNHTIDEIFRAVPATVAALKARFVEVEFAPRADPPVLNTPLVLGG